MREKIKILVMDTDIDSLTRLYIGLAQFGFNVEVSDRVEDAQQRLHRFKPDIILAEQTFLDSIVKNSIKQRAKIVYLVNQHRELPLPGDFVSKPFKVSGVAEKLKKLFRKRHK